MPKVISYTPKWLSRPSPGFQLFNTSKPTSSEDRGRQRGSSQRENGNSSASDYIGPTRIMARRGTEIFVVVGKYIRWTDLVSLKDDYEEQSQTPSRKPRSTSEGTKSRNEDDGPEDGSYRVLKVPIAEPIRQLSISPNGNLLAIATSHTVTIAILPDSSHLGQIPNDPIKLKTYTVGPTTHVVSRSQVTNVLWHPFGVEGNCLATVTADASVRLWEFNRDNKWSSDSPSLAMDLKKLVMGSSEEENFAPDRIGRSRRFSVDNVGLEVASACFGGTGASNESGWSAMTMWIAMKGGDVYALCPLLPSRWQPSATLIPSLSTAAVAKAASKLKEGSPESDEEQQSSDQLHWLRDVDGQEPTLLNAENGLSPEIFRRPSHPGPVPRLQGPFQILSEDVDEELELSDIHVIAPKLDEEEFMGGDDSDSEADSIDENGTSASVIALMTRSGRVYACLDLEGVEGQWLPRRKPKHLLPPPKDPYLAVYEGLDTLSPVGQLDQQWPTFSEDVNSRYSFFTTHNNGVFFFSLDPWVQTLEKELQNSEKLGAPLRIDVIKNGPGTLREQILSFDQDRDSALDSVSPATACLNFQDSDLGYFLLTSVGGQPEAATLDKPYHPYEKPMLTFDDDDGEDFMPDMNLLNLGPARSTYHPPDAFYAESSLPRFIDTHVESRHRRMMKEEVRLSTVTLDLMTQAHRVLSQETHQLGLAASDLFRRCERLQDELRDQINRANEVAQRIEKVAGEDADPYLDSIRGRRSPSLDDRLETARSRQGELAGRYEALRKKFGSVGGKTLSEKEQLWIAEVDRTQDTVAPPSAEHEEDAEPASELWHRCREAENLKEDLVARAKELSKDDGRTNDEDTYEIPIDLRRAKVTQVKRLLETQSALVEAVQSRLERLSVSVAL